MTGVEASSHGRSLKVIAGESMLTPVERTTVTHPDGTKETLVPRRSRFSVEHPWVQERPELFKLCVARGDRSDAPARFRAALRAAERSVTRQLAEARGERLPARPTTSTGDEPWRL